MPAIPEARALVRFKIMDAATGRYTLGVASAMAAVLGSQLAGVYLHGSAVLRRHSSAGIDEVARKN
jgi:hypothetical protein